MLQELCRIQKTVLTAVAFIFALISSFAFLLGVPSPAALSNISWSCLPSSTSHQEYSAFATCGPLDPEYSPDASASDASIAFASCASSAAISAAELDVLDPRCADVGEMPKKRRLAPPYPARTILERRRSVVLSSEFDRRGGSTSGRRRAEVSGDIVNFRVFNEFEDWARVGASPMSAAMSWPLFPGKMTSDVTRTREFLDSREC